MNEPKVSVVIPVYNCASTISLAIDSVLRQNVDLELIVVNDCSSDDLDSVMARYAGNPAVVYLKNEHNLGASGSRNRAVAQARGEYIAFLDSDDYWTEDKLSRQLEILEKTKGVLCCTARELMTPEGALTGRIIPVKQEISYREILKHNSINCSSVLIRADVAKAFPMNHDDAHEDYLMWIAVLKQYGTAYGINEPMLKYRLSNTGKSGSKLQSAAMTFRVYRYAGFGLAKSILLFCRYAFHGVKKYMFS